MSLDALPVFNYVYESWYMNELTDLKITNISQEKLDSKLPWLAEDKAIRNTIRAHWMPML